MLRKHLGPDAEKNQFRDTDYLLIHVQEPVAQWLEKVAVWQQANHASGLKKNVFSTKSSLP